MPRWVLVARAIPIVPERANVETGSGRVLVTDHLVGLWTLLPLNDVELDLVPLFQTLVSINLDGAVVDEDVGSVISSDESVAFGVVKPFDFAFVLRHEPCPSLEHDFDWVRAPTCLSKRRRMGWFGFPPRGGETRRRCDGVEQGYRRQRWFLRMFWLDNLKFAGLGSGFPP